MRDLKLLNSERTIRKYWHLNQAGKQGGMAANNTHVFGIFFLEFVFWFCSAGGCGELAVLVVMI